MSVQTFEENPELEPQAQAVIDEVWPPFMLQGNEVGNRYWYRLLARFAPFQFVLLDGEAIMAAGNAVPLYWDGSKHDLPSGWDDALTRGLEDATTTPNTLCALSMSVAPPYQGRKLSRLGLETMRSLAKQHGLDALIAPVRPTLKHRYPLTPIAAYAAWTQADGSLFDPWLRTHQRLGADVLDVAPRSMVVRGTVAAWEGWAQMRLPESGAYIVEGALQPVTIDAARDLGLYEDPNVWMQHAL